MRCAPQTAAAVLHALLRRLVGSRVRIVGGDEGTLHLAELDTRTGSIGCFIQTGAGSFWCDSGNLRFPGREDEHEVGGPAA